MFSFFKRNKAAIVFSVCGVAKALLDNYWVFTNLPLAGSEESHHQETGKVFYLLAEGFLGGLVAGGVGHIIDRLPPREKVLFELEAINLDDTRNGDNYRRMSDKMRGRSMSTDDLSSSTASLITSPRA